MIALAANLCCSVRLPLLWGSAFFLSPAAIAVGQNFLPQSCCHCCGTALSFSLTIFVVLVAVGAGLPSEADAEALHQRTAAAQRRVDRLVRRCANATAGIPESPEDVSEGDCELDITPAPAAPAAAAAERQVSGSEMEVEMSTKSDLLGPESVGLAMPTAAVATNETNVANAAGLATADNTKEEAGPWQRRCGSPILIVVIG
jgi:hypothetical protein